MSKYFYLILCLVIVSGCANKPEEYQSGYTIKECQEWCLKRFRRQESVICLTGCNMNKEIK